MRVVSTPPIRRRDQAYGGKEGIASEVRKVRAEAISFLCRELLR
jgi:hypothetical protein